ncbi:TPR domain protein [Vulgatibacter incomptus]|uniref:TPR domain protein n=1 Tax=Vulgatibacter incomptus TaxID=1391653 RepID=A0A0K1P9Y5_9BACT|nr:TPR domain protein [Vulgatibacter incomptus]
MSALSAGPQSKLLAELDVYLKYGLRDKAVAHLRTLLASDPTSIDVHERAIQVHALTGDAGARRDSMVAVVRLCAERGELERGRNCLHRLIDALPDDPELDELVSLYSSGAPAASAPAEASVVLELGDFGATPGVASPIAAVPVEEAEDFVEAEGDDELLLLPDGVEDEDLFVAPDALDDEALLVPEGDEEIFGLASSDGAADDEELLLIAGDESEDEVVEESWGGADEALAAAEPLAANDDELLSMVADGVEEERRLSLGLDVDPPTEDAEDDDALLAVDVDVPETVDPLETAGGFDAPFAATRVEIPAGGFDYAATRVEGRARDFSHAYAATRVEAPSAVFEPPFAATRVEMPAGDFEAESEGGLPPDPFESTAVEEDFPSSELAPATAPAGALAPSEPSVTEVAPPPALASVREPEAPPPAAAGASSHDDGFGLSDHFDFAGDLTAELADEWKDEAKAPDSSKDFQYSVDDVLAEFKKGVSRTVKAEDTDTHYNLGIAYKEMELLQDAISEFDIARQGCVGQKREIECLTMRGICEALLGNHEAAIAAFLEGLGAAAATADTAMALHYEIALSNEALGNLDEARANFQRVARIDPGYRDVAEAIERVGGAIPSRRGHYQEGLG